MHLGDGKPNGPNIPPKDIPVPKYPNNPQKPGE